MEKNKGGKFDRECWVECLYNFKRVAKIGLKEKVIFS